MGKSPGAKETLLKSLKWNFLFDKYGITDKFKSVLGFGKTEDKQKK